jgi:acetylornithine deacetylase/succinyl-diaminopimelate desuccinylase-like protein
MTRTEKLLRELIALPSVNPAFLPPRDPNAGEQRVGDFLAAYAAKAGLAVEFQPAGPGRRNFLARIEPAGRVRQRILFAPHLDTVNAAPNQFSPVRKGDRLYGRGACDTKGCVAAMLVAACEFAERKRPLADTEIVFAGLADEEKAQAGSRALVTSGFKADLAIVGEPTRNVIMSAHKGSLWLRLTARGRSAHGSWPEKGSNAVHEIARVAHALETAYASELRRRKHPLLGHATVSVGVIAGGTQPNIVPAEAHILVDRRTLPGETFASVRRELVAFLKRNGLSATVSSEKESECLPLETNPRLPLIAQFLRGAKQPSTQGVRYFCDASVLGHGGIPSVVFGPGDIAQAHTADEWISLKSLERGKDILSRFLASFS